MNYIIMGVTALVFTIICYCTIPVILRFTLIKKKQLSRKQLLVIVIANAIVIFFGIHILDLLISGENYEKISLTPAALYSFINYWILSSGNGKYHSVAENSELVCKEPTATDEEVRTVSKETKIANVAQTEIETTESCVSEHVPHANETSDSKTANSRNKLPITILSCACAALLIAVIWLGISNYNLTAEANEYLDDLDSMEEEYEDYYDYKMISIFYLDNAPLIIEGDNTYYHRYFCPQTMASSGRYMIFNIEAAKGRGYSACPVCFQSTAETYVKTSIY